MKGANHKNFKHGARLLYPKEYGTWKNIKQRCYNKSNKDYNDYGGRGILMDKRWVNDFMAFFNHVGLAPSKDHWLDRIKNNRGYGYNNVRWATVDEQQRNKRNNVWIEHDGKRMVAADRAKQFKATLINLLTSIDRHGFEYVYIFYTKGDRSRSKTKQLVSQLNNSK